MKRAQVVGDIASVIGEIPLSHPTRVAIDGRDGAGKTMLAGELAAVLRSQGYDVVRASVDGFHNPRALRYLRGRYSPEGYFRDSFNYDALREMLLEPMGPNGSREYRTAAFDWREDAPIVSPLRRCAANAVLLVDGIFMLRPRLIGYWDFRIFLDVTAEIGLARCLRRESPTGAVNAEARHRYLEGQRLYFAECNPRALADVVLDNNDLLAPLPVWNRR